MLEDKGPGWVMAKRQRQRIALEKLTEEYKRTNPPIPVIES